MKFWDADPIAGRAESWCELSLVDTIQAWTHDRIHVGLRDLTDGEGPVVRRLGASPELRGSALLEQLLMTTAAMRGERLVTPPGTSSYDYKFPPHFGMDARDTAARERSAVQMPPRIERFILEGPAQSRYLRPSILETLTVAEAMRSAAMRHSSGRELRSADPLLSGKGPNGEPATGHGHAFFLPRDLDEDSHIDHLDVWFPCGSSNDAHRAIVSVRSLYDGRLDLPPNASYSLTHLGNADLVMATRWRSATPFVLERDMKFTSRRSDEMKADGPEAQVRRSLQQNGFPEPLSVEITDGVQLINSPMRRKTRGDAFRRMRRRDTYAAPGFAVEITFSQAICGPLRLGRYSHFRTRSVRAGRSGEGSLNSCTDDFDDDAAGTERARSQPSCKRSRRSRTMTPRLLARIRSALRRRAVRSMLGYGAALSVSTRGVRSCAGKTRYRKKSSA